MAETSIIFSDVNERQGVFSRRVFLMGGVVAFGLFALTGRLAQLQLIEGGKYRRLSSANQFNYRLIPPPRGQILDRNGVVIAGNRPSFSVLVMRSQVKDIDETLDQIAYVLPQTLLRRRAILRDINQSRRFAPTAIATDLNWEDFAKVNLYASTIPGVDVSMDEVRVYHYGGAFSHVIGYVGKISDKDLKAETAAVGDEEQLDPILLHPGFRIGKQGIEKAFDKDLRGVAGARKIEVNATGNIIAEDSDGMRPATPGEDVVLTLDAEIQQRALEVFGEDSGGAVLMNIHTGEVLCMMSAPSFDPNLFVSGISSKAYGLLRDYERLPLLDKCIGSTYAPGSTFKVATALAFLEGGINPEERVVCSGSYRYGNRSFACHKRGGHGPQTMHDAIKNSCDVYFYHMCNRAEAGPDRIAQTARALGMGHIFENFEIAGQKRGTIPDREYKRTAFKNDPKWHPGETLSVAIGQGYVTTSALQLCTYIARIANGQKAVEPYLVKKIGEVEKVPFKDFKDLPFSRAHLDIVRAGMVAVSNDVTGTAYRNSRLNLGNIEMAGKTGTAQVRSYDKVTNRRNEGIPWKLRDHGLFVAFAPADNPKYAIAVIVQHGMGGSMFAAPKAREIMKLALIKDPEMQARIIQPMPVDPNLANAPDQPLTSDAAPEPLDINPSPDAIPPQ
ncbi:penicillin-binding protein 2 [Asticcacaulis sp. SL142]|uniref:penicillin-binding protein 2 n=1 Tax=Asticcacaulis sp. SL142 TaxID=2995155 RepID=UPI00226D23DD|nr:penicillin-binding protein 2 [Asticcacaulis sp. SL142]WAC49474.1 penicillin-binding protein 2 [Asticcacaulis sp. SL142]